MASAVAESIPPERSTIASVIRDIRLLTPPCDEDETAGALEPFEDAALYDWEYRRRRDDVRFYRMLAGERGGPVLDLGCGTGRLMVPLLRDGHVVVGVDRAPPMLARAAARVARLRAELRRRALLVRGDLRALPFARSRVSRSPWWPSTASSTANRTPSSCGSSGARAPR